MKSKKFLVQLVLLMMSFVLIFSTTACRTPEPPPTEQPAEEEPVVEEPEEKPYKIGIMTGTVSQGEEEYQEAMNQIAKYGDMIVHATYPDNFSTETETTISQVVQMASDPEVKAIVFVQAIPGAAAAIEKVRETRPDMLFVAGVPAEDPPIIAEKADIVLQVDEISMGRTIPELAAKMGAKTFIHYSFPRHLSYATIARRLEIMKETCAELGIELVEVNAPDPTGDAGVSGAQQFITEDVPRQIATYGKDTAFFSTNCAMQEPLIRTIWENGAIYPQQCCPSPYHGYPAGLNIDVSGHEGDVQYMLDQIAIKLKEKGQEGRMSTWGVPINMLMIDAGVRFAIKFAEGEVTDPKDTEAFIASLNEASAARGLGNLTVTNFNEDGINLPNFLMLLAPFYDFSQNTATAEVEEVEPYKIGIMTGTVSQGEEEYQEAMNQIAKYGDMIVHATYPDNFSTETETTISQVVQMASDPEVKAIVFVQAIPGAAAAIEKVRETRPDMLFVAGVPAEDPPIIAEKADIVLQVDEISMGRTIPELAAKMGAKTFIHYSFPRHLSYATIARRLEIMKETCAELGIELVEVNAPDPTGDAGVSGAQQFITEDVPRQIATYGKDTAFFSTNCAMQEPLIRTIWENGAIYPQQCCPSPYHGYPAGLNIDVSGHEGDVQYMLDQIAIKLKEKGQEGRMSTWGVPINMLMIDAGVRFAIKFAEGEVTDPKDTEAFIASLNEASAARGLGNLTVTNFNEDGINLPNFLMLLAPFYDFSQ